jgi:hypothetical protein
VIFVCISPDSSFFPHVITNKKDDSKYITQFRIGIISQDLFPPRRLKQYKYKNLIYEEDKTFVVDRLESYFLVAKQV